MMTFSTSENRRDGAGSQAADLIDQASKRVREDVINRRCESRVINDGVSLPPPPWIVERGVDRGSPVGIVRIDGDRVAVDVADDGSRSPERHREPLIVLVLAFAVKWNCSNPEIGS